MRKYIVTYADNEGTLAQEIFDTLPELESFCSDYGLEEDGDGETRYIINTVSSHGPNLDSGFQIETEEHT